jgi:hypothetical protein
MGAATQALPEVLVEGRSFSRVILGHNPFLGYSYYSQARAQGYERRFADQERISEVIRAALDAGARGMMLSFDHPRQELIVNALSQACEATGVHIPTFAILSPGFQQQAGLLKRANSRVGLLHGQVTDKLYRPETQDFAPEFADHMARMRDLGLVPGASTHNAGETVPAMAGHDVAVVNTPVNMLGWHMRPSRESALAAIAATDRIVVGMKPLAMARIPPEEGMTYTLGRPEVDLVVVGIATPEEARETFGAALKVIQSK